MKQAPLEVDTTASNGIMTGFCPQRVLPKRVLKIVNDHVSLIISSEEEVQDYVALSYRWGDGLPLKLTEEAMGAFIQGRPISELSKTLQDAVHISRNLGFEYLWIDALCIIQGDEADWADQSAKMADIYRHSSLNLCAADSAGCGSGMVEMAAPHLMEIAASPAQSANLTETVVLLGGPIARAVIDVSGCGLQSRGWVFQEGLCSSRGLYISCRHDLWWGCRTMIDTIDACKPPITGDTDHAFNPLTLRRSFFLDDGEMSAQDFAFTWYDWMEQYTLRDLTLRTDRLPAVAGMAKYIAKVSEMKYTAGLWEGDLLCGLVWHRGGSDYARRMPGSAPTWSWASVTGPIYYDEFFTMHVDKRGQIKECREPDLDITETTVEEERTIEGGEELSFGNVQRGEIKASGVLKDAVTMLLEEGRRWSPKWDFDIQPPEPKEEFLNECHVPRLVSAWRYKEHTRPTVYFLIVRKTGQRYGEYQRVGLGYVKLSYKQHPKRHMFSVRRSNRDDREKSGFTEQDIWGKDPKRSQLILVRNRKH
ncbi:hypothetical protein ACLX1H_000179 [Fusarium chlamydosporum]